MAEWRLPEVKLEKTPEVLPPSPPPAPEVLPPLPPPAWKRAEVEGAKKETEEGKICSRAVVLKRGDILCGNITAEDSWVMVSNPKEGFFTGEPFTYREVKELPVRSLLIPREEVEYIVEK